MRFVIVAILCLITYQAPVPTFIKAEGIACKTPSLWYNYMTAYKKNNFRELQFINLSQRCVPQRAGAVKVLSRGERYIKIAGLDQRELYIAKGYLIE